MMCVSVCHSIWKLRKPILILFVPTEISLAYNLFHFLLEFCTTRSEDFNAPRQLGNMFCDYNYFCSELVYVTHRKPFLNTTSFYCLADNKNQFIH